jgi:endoglucanase
MCVVALMFVFTGSAAVAASGWSTSGTQIVTPAGGQYVITGVNWYGFETTAYVAHGMYAKNYTTILDTIKSSGFNTVRLPFSNYMWESDPTPGANQISACSQCKGLHSRDIMALMLNYAGSIGLHVILDNHRSEAGNSAEANGLWYYSSGSSNYPESSWINDWVNIQRWLHGTQMTSGSADTVTVTYLASDGFPSHRAARRQSS